MHTINLHEAKTQLSRLVAGAVNGEPFIIAKAGKPLVRVASLDAPKSMRRLGFMAGEMQIPEDFDRMGDAKIERQFGLGE